MHRELTLDAKGVLGLSTGYIPPTFFFFFYHVTSNLIRAIRTAVSRVGKVFYIVYIREEIKTEY